MFIFAYLASKFKENNSEILWYPVPPMVAGPTLTDDFQRPMHSVEYLNYIAQGPKPVKQNTLRQLSLDDNLASILYTNSESNSNKSVENGFGSSNNSDLDHSTLQLLQGMSVFHLPD